MVDAESLLLPDRSVVASDSQRWIQRRKVAHSHGALTGAEPPLPPSLAGIEDLTESYGEMPVDYDAFKSHLIEEYR